MAASVGTPISHRDVETISRGLILLGTDTSSTTNVMETTELSAFEKLALERARDGVSFPRSGGRVGFVVLRG